MVFEYNNKINGKTTQEEICLFGFYFFSEGGEKGHLEVEERKKRRCIQKYHGKVN